MSLHKRKEENVQTFCFASTSTVWFPAFGSSIFVSVPSTHVAYATISQFFSKNCSTQHEQIFIFQSNKTPAKNIQLATHDSFSEILSTLLFICWKMSEASSPTTVYRHLLKLNMSSRRPITWSRKKWHTSRRRSSGPRKPHAINGDMCSDMA